jgi:hypothetical protein
MIICDLDYRQLTNAQLIGGTVKKPPKATPAPIRPTTSVNVNSATLFQTSFASNTTSSTALALGNGRLIPAIATTSGSGFAIA